MDTEITVSYEAAVAAMEVLREFVWEGGKLKGVKMEDVEEFLSAVEEADRIVILPRSGD